MSIQADNQYESFAGNNAVPSAARTANGSSGALRVGGDKASFLIDVTAAAGTTPSMTLAVEWSHDGATWFPADPADTLGAAVTGAVRRVRTVDVKARFCQVTWTITGTTPSFTFAIHIHSLDY